MAKWGDFSGGVAPARLGDPVRLEHHLGAQPARRQRDGGRSPRPELVRQRERHAEVRRLGEVVEEGDPVAPRVVLGGAVGHLDDEAAGRAEEQRDREVARDGVRVHRQAQGVEPVVQRGFPGGLAPLHPGRAPDVVHEHVQGTLLAVDASHERAHRIGHEVVHLHRDPPAAGPFHELRRLLDGLRPVHLRPPRAGRAPGDVDGRAGRAELDGDPSPRPAGRSRDQRHLARQRARHGASP